jgi:nitric oxide reductase large subunit
MSALEKRPLMISRGWIQAARIVLIIGFFGMGLLTYYTYDDEPPIPGIVKNTHGAVPFTRGDIMSWSAGFSGQRPDGVRLDLSSWGKSRAGSSYYASTKVSINTFV